MRWRRRARWMLVLLVLYGTRRRQAHVPAPSVDRIDSTRTTRTYILWTQPNLLQHAGRPSIEKNSAEFEPLASSMSVCTHAQQIQWGLVHSHDFVVAAKHDLFMQWCCVRQSIVTVLWPQHHDSLMHWCLCASNYYDLLPKQKSWQIYAQNLIA